MHPSLPNRQPIDLGVHAVIYPLVQQPTAEEIEAQLSGRALTAVVFFLDETFEEIAWDMSTTVVDANMQLAGLIKLTNYETFTLFESRKVSHNTTTCGLAVTAQRRTFVAILMRFRKSRICCVQVPGKGEDGQPAGLVDETVLLDDHRYTLLGYQAQAPLPTGTQVWHTHQNNMSSATSTRMILRRTMHAGTLQMCWRRAVWPGRRAAMRLGCCSKSACSARRTKPSASPSLSACLTCRRSMTTWRYMFIQYTEPAAMVLPPAARLSDHQLTERGIMSDICHTAGQLSGGHGGRCSDGGTADSRRVWANTAEQCRGDGGCHGAVCHQAGTVPLLLLRKLRKAVGSRFDSATKCCDTATCPCRC